MNRSLLAILFTGFVNILIVPHVQAVPLQCTLNCVVLPVASDCTQLQAKYFSPMEAPMFVASCNRNCGGFGPGDGPESIEVGGFLIRQNGLTFSQEQGTFQEPTQCTTDQLTALKQIESVNNGSAMVIQFSRPLVVGKYRLEYRPGNTATGMPYGPPAPYLFQVGSNEEQPKIEPPSPPENIAQDSGPNEPPRDVTPTEFTDDPTKTPPDTANNDPSGSKPDGKIEIRTGCACSNLSSVSAGSFELVGLMVCFLLIGFRRKSRAA